MPGDRRAHLGAVDAHHQLAALRLAARLVGLGDRERAAARPPSCASAVRPAAIALIERRLRHHADVEPCARRSAARPAPRHAPRTGAIWLAPARSPHRRAPAPRRSRRAAHRAGCGRAGPGPGPFDRDRRPRQGSRRSRRPSICAPTMRLVARHQRARDEEAVDEIMRVARRDGDRRRASARCIRLSARSWGRATARPAPAVAATAERGVWGARKASTAHAATSAAQTIARPDASMSAASRALPPAPAKGGETPPRNKADKNAERQSELALALEIGFDGRGA